MGRGTIRMGGELGHARGAVCAAILALVVVGCARVPIRVAESHPRPGVTLFDSPRTLALHLDVAIPDVFALRGGAFHSPVWQGFAVERWRSTLTRAFDSAFFPPLRHALSQPEQTLDVRDAELSFDSTSWEQAPGERCDGRYCIYARARVHFRARLVDSDGRILRYVEGDAASRTRFRVVDDAQATESASSAVEVMYEQIAAALFSDAGAGAAPADVAKPSAG